MSSFRRGSSSSSSSSNGTSDLYHLLSYGLQIGGMIVLTYYVAPYLIDRIMDGTGRVQKDATVAEKLQRPDLKNLTFTKHELIISNDIVPRGSCEATFSSVGGLDKEIRQIREAIVVPMRLWEVYKGKRRALRYPSGMLLYGRPGTGKTMCVQALANEVEASLICIKASTLVDKYIGESPKLVTGLFSLARKIAPTVIFIDEIDTLMRNRGMTGGADSSGGIAMDAMQGAFLSEWDGLQGSVSEGEVQPPVIVVGATNRPNSLDKAILRRMPVSIQMPMPSAEAREEILRKQTGEEELAEDFQWAPVVKGTAGFSGSDIRELLRVAVLRRDQELTDAVMAVNCGGSVGNKPNTIKGDKHESSSTKHNTEHCSSKDSNKATTRQQQLQLLEEIANRPLRPLNNADFEYALTRANPTGKRIKVK